MGNKDSLSADSSPSIGPYQIGFMHGEDRIAKIIVKHKNRARDEGRLDAFGALLDVLKEVREGNNC